MLNVRIICFFVVLFYLLHVLQHMHKLFANANTYTLYNIHNNLVVARWTGCRYFLPFLVVMAVAILDAVNQLGLGLTGHIQAFQMLLKL